MSSADESIVKAIVEGYGGRVSAESGSESGSTFRVELPLWIVS